MSRVSPPPITPAERRARRDRIWRVARRLGFAGRIEYRHVYSQTGGAQYGQGTTEADDLLTVYAEAFQRDADPEDFSLEDIVAHERGHQLLVRHRRIAKWVRGRISAAGEEVLASLLGAMRSVAEADRDALVAHAIVALLNRGVAPAMAVGRVGELWDLLGSMR